MKPTPAMNEDSNIGVGFTRVVYRRLFRNLFRITVTGRQCNEDFEFGFKAKHLMGKYWWVNLRSFNDHVRKFEAMRSFERAVVTDEN